MLFNEPKLLKFNARTITLEQYVAGFSALQRAEIAEINSRSALDYSRRSSFSALQRAEIAEISGTRRSDRAPAEVSVLFNEPKLLKSNGLAVVV